MSDENKTDIILSDRLNITLSDRFLNDRRTGVERRKFFYTAHIPERRFGNDRRSVYERRRSINIYRKQQKNTRER